MDKNCKIRGNASDNEIIVNVAIHIRTQKFQSRKQNIHIIINERQEMINNEEIEEREEKGEKECAINQTKDEGIEKRRRRNSKNTSFDIIQNHILLFEKTTKHGRENGD